jgi:hypothetical protein
MRMENLLLFISLRRFDPDGFQNIEMFLSLRVVSQRPAGVKATPDVGSTQAKAFAASVCLG